MTETTYTDPTPDVRAFKEALPGRARGQLHNTSRLIVLVSRAVRVHGWTVDQLVAECTRNTGVVSNVGGLIMFRLEHCADNPPPGPERPFTPLPFCSPDCAERAGWIEDENGRPIDRCPCRTPKEATA